MLDQDALYLERPYAVAGGEYDVVGPPDEPQVAVGVAVGAVAREVETVPENGLGLVGLLPVLIEEYGRTVGEGEVAGLVGRALVAFGVDDLYLAAGGGLAHRAGAHLRGGEVADEEGVLGLAVAVVDGDVVEVLPAFYDGRVQGLAGRDSVADRGEIGAFELRGLGEEAVFGGGLAEDGDVVAGD